MNEFKIFVSSKELSERMVDTLNHLKNYDSVIKKEDTIKVNEITSSEADVLVLIGDAPQSTLLLAQKNSKPVLLCDIDCSKFEKPKSEAIPFTWGLYSNKDKEKAFLEHYNLSFVYDDDNEDIADYIAPLVFHMLEEFSFHNKYNTNFGYKKQAEFIHKFTQFYLDKMKQLVEAEGFVREDIKGDFNHIIYRYRPNDAEKPFKSIDGRDYDFVIEYHRGKPSEGIYYGIKGEVRQGDLKEQCEKFRTEWPNIFMMDKSKLQKLYNDSRNDSRGKDIFWGYNFQLELTEILNNTFPWKDFLKCYKPTDNMWEQRYWLFWVTLNDDEDIVNVATRAVKLIAKTFKRCMNMNAHDRFFEAPKGKTNGCADSQKTYFTEDSYERFIKKMEYDGSGKSYGEMLIDKLEKERYVFIDDRYEKCYRCKKTNKAIKEKLNDIKDGKEGKEIKFPCSKSNDRIIPWSDIDHILLPNTLNPSNGSFENA